MGDDDSFKLYRGKEWQELCQKTAREGVKEDVKFLFKDCEDFLKSHKHLLAARSPVFHAMFYGPLATTKAPGEEMACVEIDDVGYKPFDYFLKLLVDPNNSQYSWDGQLSLDILYAAKKYMMDDIEELLISSINSNIHYSNAYLYLTHGRAFYGKIHQALCWQVMTNSPMYFIESKGFLDMAPKDLAKFLSFDTLDINEIHLVKATYEWAKHMLSKKGKQINPERIRSVLSEDIMKAIRWPLLSIDDFYESASRDILDHKTFNHLLFTALNLERWPNKFSITPRLKSSPPDVNIIANAIELCTETRTLVNDYVEIYVSGDFCLRDLCLIPPASSSFSAHFRIMDNDKILFIPGYITEFSSVEKESYVKVLFSKPLRITSRGVTLGIFAISRFYTKYKINRFKRRIDQRIPDNENHFICGYIS